jgi:hypothetical protein
MKSSWLGLVTPAPNRPWHRRSKETFMWILIVVNLTLGSVSAIPGFATDEGCKAEAKFLTEKVLVEVPATKWRALCTEAH